MVADGNNPNPFSRSHYILDKISSLMLEPRVFLSSIGNLVYPPTQQDIQARFNGLDHSFGLSPETGSRYNLFVLGDSSALPSGRYAPTPEGLHPDSFDQVAIQTLNDSGLGNWTSRNLAYPGMSTGEVLERQINTPSFQKTVINSPGSVYIVSAINGNNLRGIVRSGADLDQLTTLAEKKAWWKIIPVGRRFTNAASKYRDGYKKILETLVGLDKARIRNGNGCINGVIIIPPTDYSLAETITVFAQGSQTPEQTFEVSSQPVYKRFARVASAALNDAVADVTRWFKDTYPQIATLVVPTLDLPSKGALDGTEHYSKKGHRLLGNRLVKCLLAPRIS